MDNNRKLQMGDYVLAPLDIHSKFNPYQIMDKQRNPFNPDGKEHWVARTCAIIDQKDISLSPIEIYICAGCEKNEHNWEVEKITEEQAMLMLL